MKSVEELEREAIEARRIADVAKHQPMTDDEFTGMEATMREARRSQVPFGDDMMALGAKYAMELSKLHQIIHRLRGEALYQREEVRQLRERLKARSA